MSLPYDEVAEIYDELYGGEQRRKHVLVKNLLHPGTSTVLDLGCGTGLFAEYLPSNTYYICLDASPRMLGVFKKKRRDWKVSDAVCADMGSPPFRESSFDAITIITAIHEAEDIHNVLAGALSLLRGGGVLAVTVNRHFRKIIDEVEVFTSTMRLKTKTILSKNDIVYSIRHDLDSLGKTVAPGLDGQRPS